VPPRSFDRRLFLASAAALGLSALGGCSDSEPSGESAPPSTGSDTTNGPTTTASPAGPADYVPGAGDDWLTVDPVTHGWSPDRLDEVAAFVESSNARTFVVLSGGRIVAEHYWAGADAGTAQEIASCQKSVVSTLCGVAVDRGLLSLDDHVSDYLDPGWTNAGAAAEQAITIRHLLSMTSGLDQNTLTEVASPGAAWAYNTTAYQKLRPVLEEVAGTDIDALTRSWLWDPIGVSAASRWRERGGRGPLQVDATGARLWSLDMTARDLARFGLLVERTGTWGTERVVSSSWLAEALTPSQTMNPAYGYLWLLAASVAAEGVPDDLVAALGAGDQKVYISTGDEVVVVRQGGAANEAGETTTSFDAQLLQRLFAAR
jgi:CubicO group peptidase (beta-lactamase class C family)